MKLRLQTDYALRALILLGYAQRKLTVNQIAETFLVSKDHLVKVIQQLSRLGYVRAFPGRGGGVALSKNPSNIYVQDVIKAMEGATRILECIEDSSVCPMEPGCSLRRVLINAENAFYEAIGSTSIADLARGRRRGGIVNLSFEKKEKQL